MPQLVDREALLPPSIAQRRDRDPFGTRAATTEQIAIRRARRGRREIDPAGGALDFAFCCEAPEPLAREAVTRQVARSGDGGGDGSASVLVSASETRRTLSIMSNVLPKAIVTLTVWRNRRATLTLGRPSARAGRL